MTRLTKVTIASLVLAFITTACSQPAPTSSSEPAASPAAQRITSESVVKAVALAVEIPSGKSAVATVRLTIQGGYHINANPPTYPYLKATTLDIPPAGGVSVASVAYPKALDKKFAFAEKSLAVYEGETELQATLKADKTAKTAELSLPAQLRIQACDDRVCYAPGTIKLVIPVNIKGNQDNRETLLDVTGRNRDRSRRPLSVATRF